MPRILLRVALAAVVWLAAHTANAELVVTENDNLHTYRLTVTPAAEPSPAFKHRLVTPPHKLKRGNAPAYYRRAHAENNYRNTSNALDKTTDKKWYDWNTAETPLSQTPRAEMKEAARIGRRLIDNYIRPGTLCRDTNWGLAVEDLTGPEAIEFLLPEYQGMRGYARILALVTRNAIAEGDYRDAVECLRMNYRIGRDAAQTPFLVCGLIGIAIEGITNNNTLDLIAAPGSPNLYWALGELPAISMREALRLEMSLGERMFPLLAEAETANYARDEWNRRWAETISSFSQSQGSFAWGGPEKNKSALAGSMAAVPLAMLNYPHAKQRLTDWGWNAEQVEKMPVGQVMAIYSARVLRIHSDNQGKTWTLPFAEAQQRSRAFEKELGGVGPMSSHPNREVLPIASLLLPAVNSALKAEMQMLREKAVLRAIEAIRMHAAETGSLPNSLDEVTVVPVPKNPATGEPFRFEAEQANFVFGDEPAETGSVAFVLPAAEVGHGLELRYEIRLAK